MRVIFVLGFIVSLSCCAEMSAVSKRTKSIDELVAEFNSRREVRENLHNDAKLTTDEIVAAIRASLANRELLQADGINSLVGQILKTRQVPEGVLLDLASLSDPGGEFVFDVCDISLQLPTTGGGQVAIAVRKRFIASRTIEDEIRRLERASEPSSNRPGNYRLEDRIRQLKARVAADTPLKNQ